MTLVSFKLSSVIAQVDIGRWLQLGHLHRRITVNHLESLEELPQMRISTLLWVPTCKMGQWQSGARQHKYQLHLVVAATPVSLCCSSWLPLSRPSRSRICSPTFAFGYWRLSCSGRASRVLGIHQHIWPADQRSLDAIPAQRWWEKRLGLFHQLIWTLQAAVSILHLDFRSIIF